MDSSFRHLLLTVLLALTASATVVAGPQEDADALFADSQWAAAADAYHALLAEDPARASNWFALAQARQQLGEHAAARDAYRQALEHGFQPAARAQFHLARAMVSLGDQDAALNLLEGLVGAPGLSSAALQGTSEFQVLADNARYQAVLQALTPCTAPEYRAFDFWLGTWDVRAVGATTPPASNRITAEHGGCVILEQYANASYTGMSINFYDQATGKWHQSWMSNAGGAVYLEGGLNEHGAMVMSDADLPVSGITGIVNRVTWTPNDDGSVRQHWETSSDGGATWSTVFDGTYTRVDDEQV